MTTERRKLKLGYLGVGTGSVFPFNQVFESGILISRGRGVHGDAEFDAELKKEIEGVDALAIWGGEDISPSLYNEAPARQCHAGSHLSKRDMDEVRACLMAAELSKPLIGVCRGAQLLCALAGGKLVQHVSGHHGDHKVTTFDKKEMITSSIHHQMMWPWFTTHRLLAWTTNKQSDVYVFNDQHRLATISQVEPEVVYFPAIKGLAIQGHPEFMDADDEFVQWCMQQVNSLIVPQIPNLTTEKV